MGRAARWFRGLLGKKKEKEQRESSNAVDKKRWSFGKSGREPGDFGQIPVNIPPAEAAWLRSFYSETDNQQNKHAIAVAAATAAAADAAVAAAQAAVAVVRLTSNGRGTMFCGGRERWAAVKIQSVFRSYLARKALRALKGLVKLQALVRGYLVRKQATATLHSMQALIRAQATVRSQKARNRDHRFQPNVQSRKSTERFDDSRSEYSSSIQSRRLSTSINQSDESPKIVEVDTYRPKSRSSRRTNPSLSDLCEDQSYETHSIPFPCQAPARLSIPECRNFEDSDWGFLGDECRRFSTAQSTPRFMNSNPPVTPAKSVCANSYFHGDSNFPNYMSNTQSFRAKTRSYSAPRQRPEMGFQKKKLSLKEMVESRSSLSGVGMQKSCFRVQEALNFKKLDKSVDVDETEKDCYFQRRG